jgi:hypothetical protein
MRMLDLFCGRFGWSRAFAARGWECVGVDLVEPPNVPAGCSFIQGDVLDWRAWDIKGFDFICASSTCDGFASFGMRHFRKNPPYPHREIELFNHTRTMCQASSLPYVMENVRSAQLFVGPADAHAGSFYLWGNGIPPLRPKVFKAKWFVRLGHPGNFAKELALKKSERKPLLATIPIELAACVAEYAGHITRKSEASCI